MDTRSALGIGTELRLGGQPYHVEATLGRGSNAIVYRVGYADALSGLRHTALLKELYPNIDGVSRRDGRLTVAPEAEAAFARHRRSFERGNEAHVRQLAAQSGRVTGNRNSYEQDGTLYSVLDYQSERTLERALHQEPRQSVERSANRVFALLDALAPFHESGLLHLDVSPDNALLLPVLQGYAGETEPMVLIDYNSVWDGASDEEPCFSSKAGYTPPETRIGNRAALCPATDLFSVCAIFFEMITGRALTEAECCGQFLNRVCAEAAHACVNLPLTASAQVVRILRKGLQPLPRRRYASIDELRAAMRELLDRIHGRGVTHAALWEAARKTLPESAPVADRIPLTVRLGDNILPADPELAEELTAPTLLTGGAGSGKTELMRLIHRRYAQRYSPMEPIAYYIPLFRHQGNDSRFLRACLTEHLLPTGGASPQAMQDALERLLRQPLSGGRPRLLLLLDGLNEAGPRPEALLREIRELAGWKGLRVLAASRNAADTARLGFAEARLLPPAESDVDAFLERNGLTSVTKPETRQMLDCPLLLRLYADTWAAWRGSGESLTAVDPDLSSPEGLRRAYLEGLLTLYASRRRESETDCLRARYAVTRLLPEIAREMRRAGQPALGWKRLHAVVEKDYAQLRGRAFAMANPEFLGKSRLMLNGVRNAEEWYDLMLREMLGDQLGLLKPQPDGSCALLHESFLAGLADEAKRNNRKMRWPRVRMALLLALCAVALAIGLYAAIPRGLTQDEQAGVRALESGGSGSLLRMSQLLREETNVCAAVFEGRVGANAAPLLPPSSDADRLLSAVPWAKTALVEDDWRAVLDAPQDASRLFLGALLVLTDPTVSPEQRQTWHTQYASFRRAYTDWYLLTLYCAYDGTDEKAQAELLEQLKYCAPLSDSFLLVSRPQGGRAQCRAQADSARTMLERMPFYAYAVAEQKRWPDTQAMANELQSRLNDLKE